MTIAGIRIEWRMIAVLIVLGVVGLVGLYFFREIDLESLVEAVGYPGLFLIVFAETGLLVGFFLPGDTLLITTGLLCERGVFEVGGINGVILLIPLLVIAAILGDATGYQIGRRAGPPLFQREESRFFKRKHLEKARGFYEKHGGKTIILARFIALARTFAPTVAGAAGMPYRKFAFYNVIGGVAWVASMMLIGYFVGKAVPNIEAFFLVIVGVIFFISVAPAAIGMYRARRAASQVEG